MSTTARVHRALRIPKLRIGKLAWIEQPLLHRKARRLDVEMLPTPLRSGQWRVFEHAIDGGSTEAARRAVLHALTSLGRRLAPHPARG